MSERAWLLALLGVGIVGWIASEVIRGNPRVSHRTNFALRLLGPIFAIACWATAAFLLWRSTHAS